MAAQTMSSRIFTRETLMPRYSQRCSFSRIATRMRPASLRTNSHAAAVMTMSITPASLNHASSETSKLSKPDRPLLDPVKLPPENRICVTTMGSTSVTTEP